ncbi:hypothetical protein ABIB42_003666 [Massilia sp. UYP32]|nr:LuxR C-terminal-related transcriptional regulator [Massilia timonae]
MLTLCETRMSTGVGIAEKTIKVHRARVMEKMGATSLAQLVRETLELEAGAVFAADGVDSAGWRSAGARRTCARHDGGGASC